MYKIGVSARHNKEYKDYRIATELEEIILEHNGYPVLIIPTDNIDDTKELLNLCDGFIIPGSVDYTDYDVKLVKYLHTKDIPTLGICLGCQMIGKALNGDIDFVENVDTHMVHKDYAHNLKVLPSKLYDILQDDTIMVNSLHRKMITKTDLKITCMSQDGVIEGVEDPNKSFFIGVQWHPELMIKYDEPSKKIISAFFDAVVKNTK